VDRPQVIKRGPASKVASVDERRGQSPLRRVVRDCQALDAAADDDKVEGAGGEAIQVANDSAFGLGAAVFTKDRERGERIAAEELEAGKHQDFMMLLWSKRYGTPLRTTKKEELKAAFKLPHFFNTLCLLQKMHAIF
jgi:hypothetical protein